VHSYDVSSILRIAPHAKFVIKEKSDLQFIISIKKKKTKADNTIKVMPICLLFIQILQIA
tara:strand:+ start:34994 stop:35173 length:180 start_codon:yes stop_codon:yes gene_type:complete